MPSSHLIFSRPLLLLPSIPPSIRVFSNGSTLRMRWPEYWSFSFSIIPSKEIPGLISFRMDWLDLLAVQGTLKSLLQQHSSKPSILWHSAFFTVQFSYPYMTTGKTIALTRWTFVGKVISLLFNMPSRLVITFLPSEVGNRTGSILKAGLHLGPDCGLWAICPVSMETTYQLENQAPGRRSSRALHRLEEYSNYLCNRIESYILLCLLVWPQAYW